MENAPVLHPIVTEPGALFGRDTSLGVTDQTPDLDKFMAMLTMPSVILDLLIDPDRIPKNPLTGWVTHHAGITAQIHAEHLTVLSAAGIAFGLARVDTADEAARQAATIGLTGGIVLLVVLFLAYLAGGYVAGRMARFDGGRQGLAVWLIGLVVVVLLAALGAVLGAQLDLLAQLDVPSTPVSGSTATTAGVVAGAGALLVSLVGGLLGGKLGTRYHRRIDRAGLPT